MNLLLITNKHIIKQIFHLVTSKLNIDLTISEINVAHKKFDIIFIEDNCLDDKFNTAAYTDIFGIITKDTLAYKTQCDFLLNKPFLPSQLVSYLNNIKQLPKESEEIIPNKASSKILDISEDETTNTTNFIETLADNIGDEINEESDESVLPTAFVEQGGILDSSELSKIQDILNDTNPIEFNDSIPFSEIKEEEEKEDDNWIDLADIIDKAIDDAREYQFETNAPIKLLLNNYSIEELSPLFNKLDQNIVNALTSGDEITLQLKITPND